MPIITEYGLCREEDGNLIVQLTPPARVDQMSLHYQENHRFGAQTSGYVEKWYASGYNVVSGITILNSGEGIFRVNFTSENSTGREFGNYCFRIWRTDSGYRTIIAEGYHLLNP